MLGKNTTLEKLDLHWNNMRGDGVSVFFNGL